MAEDEFTIRIADRTAIERWEGEGGRAVEREAVTTDRPDPGARTRTLGPESSARVR